MTEREEVILGAIIDYYLTTGESIGSRTLVKKYNIDLSSATIRNVMADLEDMEYISKTHSSSGRIPTTKGYKYYLDTLLKIREISIEEAEKINHAYEKKMSEIEEVLEKTSNLLSKLSNYAGIALEPNLKTEKIKKVEFVHINNYMILAVLVSENSSVKTKKIHLKLPITEKETKELSEHINKKMQDINMNYLTYKIEDIVIEKREEVLQEIVEECFKDAEGDIFINGTPSILENIEKKDTNIVDMVKVFEKKGKLKKAFEVFVKENNFENGKVHVVLGEELDIEGFENFSFVFSTYNLGEAKGIIGVIGPKRMEYSKTLGIVEYVTNEVNKAIINIDKGED